MHELSTVDMFSTRTKYFYIPFHTVTVKRPRQDGECSTSLEFSKGTLQGP